MKKKISVLLAGVMCLTMALSACTKPEENPTPQPTGTPVPSSTETINVPDNTPTPPEIIDNPDLTPPPETTPEVNPGIDGVEYAMEETGISIYFPDSWIGKYNYELQESEETYPVARFYYIGEDGSKTETLLYFHVNAGEAPAEAMVLGEWDGNAVYLTWDEKLESDELYSKMYDDAKGENGVLSYIPPVVNIPEGSQKLIDAIVNARSEEENEYMEVVADPAFDVYLAMQNLNVEDVQNFAVSLSMMNVKAYTISIVLPAEGKEDVVKTGMQDYVDSVVQSYQNYLPDQLAVAESAILENVGDYVVLVMCENATDVFNSIKASLEG